MTDSQNRYRPGDLVACTYYGPHRVWRVRRHKPAPLEDAVLLDSLEPGKANTLGYVSELRLTVATRLRRRRRQ